MYYRGGKIADRDRIHAHVFSILIGIRKVQSNSSKKLFASFAVGLGSGIFIVTSNVSDSATIWLGVCTALAAIPLGAISQRITLRTMLAQKNLRLKRFLIGKKGYIAPKDHVLHEHADLFTITANLVCKEPFFSAHNNAAAWHSFSVLSDQAGVAIYEGWYGKNTESSLFIYGDVKTLLNISSDIWDLGHVRKLSTKDQERFLETSRGWRRQQLMPVALAYAPLPKTADPTAISSKDIVDHCILLGALGVETSRGIGDTIPVAPDLSLLRATHAQSVITMSLSFFALFSVIGAKYLSIAPPINVLIIVALSMFIAPLLLAVYSWDYAIKKADYLSTNPFSNAMLIAGVSYGIYLMYLSWQNALQKPMGSLTHETGSALAILTFGLCLLVYIGMNRLSKKRRISFSTVNPLFCLAWISSLLIVLIISFGTGPLVAGTILVALGTTLGYAAVYELWAYANRHHSREHILHMLRTHSN